MSMSLMLTTLLFVYAPASLNVVVVCAASLSSVSVALPSESSVIVNCSPLRKSALAMFATILAATAGVYPMPPLFAT